MKMIIRLEELMMFILSIVLFTYLHQAWWIYWAFLLAPDLSAAGYLFNTKTGAFTYNFVHHKGVAIAIYIAGLIMANIPLQIAGLILFGHSSMDRFFGYGLKYPDSFQHTHLGMIGKPGKSTSADKQ